MVSAWFMNDVDGEADPRVPHQLDPPQPVSLETLKSIGVLYFPIEVDEGGNYRSEDGSLGKLKKERGYTYEDTITLTPEKLISNTDMIKNFFREHLHTDEEIRLILDGCGYFDVRNTENRWIRIELRKGDLIVLPAGIYHRFTVNEDNYIYANRLFVGEPVWTPHNRSAEADLMPARAEYVKVHG